MTFIHRIGRTGRAGHSGTAVTLVGYDELPKWQIINDEFELGLPTPPQWFSTSPELAEALAIPEDVSETVGPATKVIGAPRSRSQRDGGRGSARDCARRSGSRTRTRTTRSRSSRSRRR